MTISTETRIAGPFTGTGLVATYPFEFKVFSASDLYVVETDTSGVETLLTLTTDYTVSLNADQDDDPGGSITLVAGNLTDDHLLTITTELDYLQETELTNNGGFFPRVINDALDRMVMLIQQVRGLTTRALKIPLSDSGVTVELPTAALRANKALVFDVDGNIDVSADDYDDQAANAAASATLAEAWATQMGSQVEGVDLSAKEYAVGTSGRGGVGSSGASAKDWATYTGGTVDATDYSAKHHALAAASSASSASSSASSAATSAANAAASAGNMAVDTFSGNGSQTAFTLSVTPGSTNNAAVFVSGVRQVPTAHYSVSGTTLTFVTAPPSGTSNILVVSGVTLPASTPSDGTVTGAKLAAAGMTSAQLLAALTNASGTGAAVFGTNPTISAPNITGIMNLSSGGGVISFPASQNASSGANDLDDYEEGTWTPGIAFGGGATGVTYGAQSGYYLKIGSMVTAWGRIDLTNKGSSTGSMTITGFPFTNSLGNAICSLLADAFTSYTGYVTRLLFQSGGTTALVRRELNGANSAVDQTMIQNTSTLNFVIQYRA